MTTHYSSLELIEFFNLDPELEIYSDRPAQPAPDWTPDTKLIARLKRSATNIAARVTSDAKQGKDGRHRSLKSYAMLLRENGANGDLADNLMEYFLDRLPPRGTEPVPWEEAKDVMKWVIAKEAGRNPPMHRQTGLETVAVDNGGDGQGGGGRDDDLDEITGTTARAPITIQAGGYARVKDSRDGPVFTQLTNWTFTPTLNLRWPDRTTGHRGTLTINSKQHHTIDLPAKAWNGRRELLAHIGGHNAANFSNANADIAQIQQFILTNYPGLPTAQGVTTYGLHKHHDSWIQLYEDTQHPELFYVGTPVDPSPAYRSTKPGSPDELTAAKRTIAALPHLITSAAALALLGYAMASAYAPRITPELGDRLPFLYLTGERESGKSSSIELALALVTGHPSARLRKAGGLTPYQYDSAFANMNNRLSAIDEYRPGTIDDAQLRKHHDLAAKYRGSGMAAKDHAYWLNSPLIVAGEGFTDDAAALSRGPLYFINKEDRGDTHTYLDVQQAPNHVYAHHLTNAAATLPEPEHQARLSRAWQHARATTDNRGGPRLQFALTWIAYGLLHLQADGFTQITDQAIQRTLEVGVLQTLDGGTESKTNLETFLEQLGSAAADLKDPSTIIVPTAANRHPVIRISGAVELVKRRYGPQAAISNPRMLRQFAAKVEWVNENGVHKDRFGSVVRGIRIDLRAAPSRCDLGMLEAIEDRIISENR